MNSVHAKGERRATREGVLAGTAQKQK